MGLDVYAISKIATKKTDPEVYEFQILLESDTDCFGISQDFPDHTLEYGTEGIVEYVHTMDSAQMNFRAGSYSGYNKFRNFLSISVYGVSADEAWKSPDVYCSKPLWGIVNFSDCEGTFDSIISKKIHKELLDNKDSFIKCIEGEESLGGMDKNHYIETYDNFIKAFSLGADNGIVTYA